MSILSNILFYLVGMWLQKLILISLGGSNGCADQFTNWEGIQKVGLEAPTKRKTYEQSR